MPGPFSDSSPTAPRATSDSVGLSWLVTVRWAGIAAAVGALVAGANLDDSAALSGPVLLLGLTLLSNLWLTWRIRRSPDPATAIGGGLVAADVVTLSWILHESGGVLNPFSIVYLIDIVLAALVLGRSWTWTITLLSVAGYGVLFLAPSSELAVAGAMHPEIATHVQGMWVAFAATALIVALLVSRLASMVERRDRALEALRDRAARDARIGGLATLAAGAAHELSTPLATIAVASRELQRGLGSMDVGPSALADVQLIREEVGRCRRVLEDMAGRISEPVGEMPTALPAADVVQRALAALSSDESVRIDVGMTTDVTVRWPVTVVVRALVNILRNGLQASGTDGRVMVHITHSGDDTVTLQIEDHGQGMAADVHARAGEPFFTTKPEGTGMGLGLFVSQVAVDQLGGAMRLESREGEGTTVTMTLPAHTTRETRA